MTENAETKFKKMFSGNMPVFAETDPEYFKIITNFALDEVQAESGLDDKTRMMVILATLLGCQSIDLYKEMVGAALNLEVSPVEIKEIVYQATAYLGIARVYEFLKVTNEVLQSRGIKLPLEQQGTVTSESRLTSGNDIQVKYFGPGMREYWTKGDENQRHIQKWLADNCFGDYYTRKGLNDKQREMITFCYILAQGGCESQLTAHAMGNMGLGNDKNFLIKVVSECVPYIGYPRSLNAITCVNNAAEQLAKIMKK